MPENELNWLLVDPEELNEIRKQESGKETGLHLKLEFSPYDIPNRVRGRFDDGRDRFVIEFEYIQHESKKQRIEAREHVAFIIGKNSKRLYEIEINAKALGLTTVKLEVAQEKIVKVIQEQKKSVGGDALGRDSYDLASSTVETKATQLLAPLVGHSP